MTDRFLMLFPQPTNQHQSSKLPASSVFDRLATSDLRAELEISVFGLPKPSEIGKWLRSGFSQRYSALNKMPNLSSPEFLCQHTRLPKVESQQRQAMPRHSTGCRNCVRRRILCDELSPVCENCRNRNIVCDGRHTELQFVHTANTSRYPSSSSNKRHGAPQPARRNRKSPTFLEQRQCYPLTSWGVTLTSSSLDAYFCFLLLTAGRQDQIWLQYCARNRHSYSISNLAIEALSTAKFAKVHRNPALLVTAAQKYSKALIKLQTALTGIDRDDFDVLAAITAMNRYELLVCTIERSWIQHAGGVGEVIRIMGPKPFTQSPFSAILDSNRQRIIHEAYYRRKPTFLRRNEWQEIRAPLTNAEKCFHKVQNFYGVISEVAADFASTAQSADDSIRQKQIALNQVDRLIQDLDDWMEDWKDIRSFTPTELNNNEPSRKAFYSDCDGLLFANSLDYPTLEDNIGMNMCLAIKLTALEWQKKLQQPSWWPGYRNQNMVDIPQARTIGQHICRSLHHHFDASGHVRNEQYLVYFAIIAHKAFHRQSREMRWLQTFLTRIADLTGIEVARNWINSYENKWAP